MANYNVDIIYNGSGSLPGTETLRIDGSANVLVNRTSTLNSSKFAVTGNTWHQNGLAVFSNPGNGESYPNITATAMMLGPYSTRSGTAGKYLAGIGFDHLLNYSTEGNMTYNQSPHGWIGLRTETFPGYETSSLVFATRSDTSGAANSTIERMCITSNGDIQFGYNSTSTVLIGRSFATAHANGNRGGTLKYGIDDGSFGGMIVYNVASGASGYNSQFIAFNTHEGAVSAAERMRITSAGRVGIGTTNPTVPLAVVGGTAGNPTISASNAAAFTGGNNFLSGQFAISNISSDNAGQVTRMTMSSATGGQIMLEALQEASDGGATSFLIRTRSDASGVTMPERFRILSNGNVGIGTTSPEGRLDIVGSPINGTQQADWSGAGISYNSFGDVTISRRHGASKDSTYGYTGPIIDFRSSNTGSEWSVAQIMGTVDPQNGNLHQGGLVFLTSSGGTTDPTGRRNQGAAPQARMLISHSGDIFMTGNLGIGTLSSGGRLHLFKGAADVYQTIEADNGYNAYTNYRGYSSGISFGRDGGNGNFRWSSAVDFGGSQLMVLTTSGNLGIGTTSPAAKLEVAGTTRTQKLEGYSFSTSGSTIDTGITAADFTVLEVFGSANPNAGGSGAYRDPIHFYIYHGRGWNGSAVTSYIYTQAVAPPARSMYVSGSGSSANDPIDAVWLTGSTESDSCPLDSSSHQVRIKITNYNATYGSNFSVTVIKRF